MSSRKISDAKMLIIIAQSEWLLFHEFPNIWLYIQLLESKYINIQYILNDMVTIGSIFERE